MPNYQTISVGKGKAALVDAADHEWLSQFNWHVTDRGYAIASHKGQRLTMHRLIMETPKGMLTDHINGNRLDNRRLNLRICTHHGNSMNKGISAHTSKYKGVGWKKLSNNWQARIRHNGKWMHIGIYSDEVAAAVAYNERACALFGEFARLNVIPADWQPTQESEPYRLKNITSCKKKTFRGREPSSKYKGVSATGKKWKAMIKVDGKFHYLGHHDTQEQAAIAYNAKALEFWGDRAWLNPVPENHNAA